MVKQHFLWLLQEKMIQTGSNPEFAWYKCSETVPVLIHQEFSSFFFPCCLLVFAVLCCLLFVNLAVEQS